MNIAPRIITRWILPFVDTVAVQGVEFLPLFLGFQVSPGFSHNDFPAIGTNRPFTPCEIFFGQTRFGEGVNDARWTCDEVTLHDLCSLCRLFKVFVVGQMNELLPGHGRR